MSLLRFSGGILLACFLYAESFAAIHLQVFSKDEGFYETNISKPRIYISNLATSETISNFFAYYYFTVENGKTPVLDDYYTPLSIITLENLGSGLCRVKLNYTGVTLQPGQTIPNTDGEVFGLHYTDWSAFDKTNDPSNNRQTVFTLNNAIPVYLADGTLIYGDGIVPPTPPVPQMPPEAGDLGNYAVYSLDRTDLRDRVYIQSGDVGSAGTLEAGCDAVVTGSAFSGGEMTLRERAKVTGDAIAGGRIVTQNNVIIQGIRRENATMELPSIAHVEVTPGSLNITVSPNTSYTLNPGAYADFQAYAGSTVMVKSGSYSFRKFQIEPDVNLVFEAGSNGKTVTIRVKEYLRFGDRMVMSLAGGLYLPFSVSFYSAQTTLLPIGTNSTFNALLIAPDAEVHCYSNSEIHGALFGKTVVIEPDVSLCKPPALADLYHSEWAMAPVFDPLVFGYTSVVPDATSTLLVTPVPRNGQTVTVNGSSPSLPINLTGTETNVSVLLSNTAGCGTTAYSLNVRKAGRYQIYVNDNSPCAPGAEDGTSWATAYKDLQVALDRAGTEGREIWIAEGTYKPSRRTTAGDPRSVTFLIQSGTELIGGFNGTETEKKPQGSAYNTILSGDIAGNDGNISTWPPSAGDETYLADNAYHVVTIRSIAPSKGIHLARMIIQCGAATGTGENGSGAGIFNKNCSPTLDLVGLRKNLSASSGAGLFDNGGVSLINSLFKDNVTRSGSGAGMYSSASSGSVTVDASVFDGNRCNDNSAATGGAGLCVNGAELSIVNSVFTRNVSSGSGGALNMVSGSASLMNCTFSGNTATNGGCGIAVSAGASVTICNSILWDPAAQTELKGSGYQITYSCVRDGYGGTGNISANPLFSGNSSVPEGADGRWGTTDDALKLATGSPCRDNGKLAGAPDVDIIRIRRPAGSGIERGAYEYLAPDRTNKLFFGTLVNGVFTQNDDLTIIGEIMHVNEVYHYCMSKFQRVARAYIEKNEYTEPAGEMTASIWPLKVDGSAAAPRLEVTLKAIGEEEGLLVFQSLTPDRLWGKRLLFVKQRYWHGLNNPWTYVVYLDESSPKVAYEVPLDQFSGGK